MYIYKRSNIYKETVLRPFPRVSLLIKIITADTSTMVEVQATPHSPHLTCHTPGQDGVVH